MVAVIVLTGGEPAQRQGAAAVVAPRAGAPPLVLDLGVRTDAEAAALRRASRLYVRGRHEEAGQIFARFGSVEARIGTAFAAWPDHSLQALERLAASHPRSALAQLHLGLGLFWAGRNGDAIAAWREAARVEPDSASAIRAGDLLHPNFPRGLPIFVPSFRPPAGLARLSPPRQLEVLAASARTGGVRAKLLYGVALQRLGRQLSAERQYAAAAALDPGSTDAQVAAAVGRFDKDVPALAFSRLGPLTRRFPRSPTVRFHLGLLLLWLGNLDEAKRQLSLARAEGPSSPLGREADLFLRRLASIRTN